jgi:AraC family transcriptional regulator
MQKFPRQYGVELLNIAPIQLGVFTHKGAPELLGYSLQKFIQWRKKNGLPPDKARTFNIIYCADDIEPKDDFRCDLAIEYPYTRPLESPDMHRGEIAGGLYARIIHHGDDESLEPAVRYLYGDWLRDTSYVLRDAPLFFERKTFYPAVPMHQRETHIYLPLQEK